MAHRILISSCHLKDKSEIQVFSKLIRQQIERIVLHQDKYGEVEALNAQQRKDLWLLPDDLGLVSDSKGLYIDESKLGGVLVDYMKSISLHVLIFFLDKIHKKELSCSQELKVQFEYIISHTKLKNKLPIANEIKHLSEKDNSRITIKSDEKLEMLEVFECEFYRVLRILSCSKSEKVLLSPYFVKKAKLTVMKDKRLSSSDSIYKLKFKATPVLEIRYPMLRLDGGLKFDSLNKENKIESYTTTKKRMYKPIGFTCLTIKNVNIRQIITFELAIIFAQLIVWILRNRDDFDISVFQKMNIDGQSLPFGKENIDIALQKPSLIFERVFSMLNIQKDHDGVYAFE
ncbi:hypothetical protein [Photobacterium leiognathi]|uniref:hypothetical protein n=1 Tax=Photobacterium leiognathi TaxID=553611 RepID=UPI0029816E45|nr:hypothetical protein [Photobacterium leiognathi]